MIKFELSNEAVVWFLDFRCQYHTDNIAAVCKRSYVMYKAIAL